MNRKRKMGLGEPVEGIQKLSRNNSDNTAQTKTILEPAPKNPNTADTGKPAKSLADPRLNKPLQQQNPTQKQPTPTDQTDKKPKPKHKARGKGKKNSNNNNSDNSNTTNNNNSNDKKL